MIKASCNGGDTEISINGNLPELCADVLTIINSIYKAICEEDEASGMMFKVGIETEISHAFEDCEGGSIDE